MFEITRMTNGPQGPSRLFKQVSEDELVKAITELYADKSKNRVWVVRDDVVYCAWTEGETCVVVDFSSEESMRIAREIFSPADSYSV